MQLTGWTWQVLGKAIGMLDGANQTCNPLGAGKVSTEDI